MQRNWLITLRDHFFGRPSRLWRAQYIVTKILLRIKSKQRCRDQDFIDLLIADFDNGRDVSDPRGEWWIRETCAKKRTLARVMVSLRYRSRFRSAFLARGLWEQRFCGPCSWSPIHSSTIRDSPCFRRGERLLSWHSANRNCEPKQVNR